MGSADTRRFHLPLCRYFPNRVQSAYFWRDGPRHSHGRRRSNALVSQLDDAVASRCSKIHFLEFVARAKTVASIRACFKQHGASNTQIRVRLLRRGIRNPSPKMFREHASFRGERTCGNLATFAISSQAQFLLEKRSDPPASS